MLNLLTNAVRHSPRGTGLVQVKLDMECVSGQAVCKEGVLDNGPGIAPEMKAHLFEKYRAEMCIRDRYHAAENRRLRRM